MAETPRLSAWGWFVRAFAGGVGAMFGVITALLFACVACYVVFAAGMMALSSFGSVSLGQPITVSTGGFTPAINDSPMLPTQDLPQVYANPYAAAPEPATFHAPASGATPYPVASQPTSYSAEPVLATPYEDASANIFSPPATEAE